MKNIPVHDTPVSFTPPAPVSIETECFRLIELLMSRMGVDGYCRWLATTPLDWLTTAPLTAVRDGLRAAGEGR